MKTQLIALAAGALLSAATLTSAYASAATDQWIVEARSALQARVAEAGLADDGKVVVIRIKATGDKGWSAPAVERSSGSADFDLAVRGAVKDVRLPAPPAELNGRRVTFTLGQPAAGAASAAN